MLIEERDPTQEREFSYGEAHPERDKFPHHQLAYVEERNRQNGDGTYYLWYYVAKRDDQDLYNYELSYPFAGLTTCPRIERVYVIPRASYRPLAKGSLDPLSGRVGAEFELFQGAKLVDEKLNRISKEFDALFVAVTRVYERVPSRDEQGVTNAELSYPYQGNKNLPRVTRRFVVERSAFQPLEKGSSDLGYPGAKLAQQNTQRFSNDPGADSRYILEVCVYDTFPSEEIKTFSSEMHLDIPAKFRSKTVTQIGNLTRGMDLETRDPAGGDPTAQLTEVSTLFKPESDERATKAEQVTRMRAYVEELSGWEMDPHTGLILPVTQRLVPAGTNGKGLQSDGTYEEVEAISPYWGVKVTRHEPPRDIPAKFLNKQKVTYSTSPVSGSSYDESTGRLVPFSQQLVPAGTAGTPLQTDGTFTEVEPLNPNWSVATTRKATSLGSTEGTQREYETQLHYTWAPILRGVYFWEYGGRTHYKTLIKPGYGDLCRAEITEQFFTVAPTVEDPVALQPEDFTVDMLTYVFHLPACLHKAFNIWETRGTTTITVAIPATNYEDWPEYVDRVEVHPWKGGYLKVTTRVYSPTQTEAPNWE